MNARDRYEARFSSGKVTVEQQAIFHCLLNLVLNGGNTATVSEL
jgi:hypothetical protein